jgi:hypothetical protein
MSCLRKKLPPFSKIIDKLELNEVQKETLKHRYVKLLVLTNNRACAFSVVYYVSHIVVTVGSLLVPALLSSQYITTDISVYWSTWTLSLLVTAFNALLTFFKIDKKYFFLNTNTEHLISEGWQYAQLSGRYSGFHTKDKKPTHENQFIFFCHKVEKIRMKEIEDEFKRPPEFNQPSTEQKSDPIVPITPMNLQSGTTLKLKPILEEAESSPIADGGRSRLLRLSTNSTRNITNPKQDSESDSTDGSEETSGQVSVPVTVQQSPSK